MNIALSFLSETAQAQGVIERLLGYSGDSTAIAKQQIADPDYWGSVGILTITGLLVVFFILALLIFFFWAMGKLFTAIKANGEKKAAEKAKPAAAIPAAEAALEEAEDDADDDDEIMAVISAAIAAYSEQDGVNYTIRDVKRRDKRNRPAWSLAGIGENTRPF